MKQNGTCRNKKFNKYNSGCARGQSINQLQYISSAKSAPNSVYFGQRFPDDEMFTFLFDQDIRN